MARTEKHLSLGKQTAKAAALNANGIYLWAETEAEANDFIDNLSADSLAFSLEGIFVGKRGKLRPVGDSYLQGIFYEYDLQRRGLTHRRVTASRKLIDIVQWCCPDLIFTRGSKPLLAIETTYHTLTFNNLAQRIPRVVKAAMHGVPGILFQKYDPHTTLYVGWFAKAFLRATRIFGTPALALLFTDDTFEAKRHQLIDIINQAVMDPQEFRKGVERILREMKSFPYNESRLINGARGTGRGWLRIERDAVTVLIGAKPGTRSWRTKGTGSMDPYPGLVKMAELLFCYDDRGERIRKHINVHFRFIPRNFWWFQQNPNELYYRLLKEIADQVTYSDPEPGQ
jgi:hypothetical protein